MTTPMGGIQMDICKRTFIALLLGFSAIFTNTANAQVEIKYRFNGDVLLFPLYTVNNGNDTLIRIVNPVSLNLSPDPVAVKLRFFEGMNGQNVFNLNIYLGPNDSWDGALTRSGDGVKLISGDSTCTVPAIPQQGLMFSNASYQGSTYHNGKGGPQGLDRTRVGHIEAYSMGGLHDSGIIFTPATWATAGLNGIPNNCAALVSAWSPGGIWASDPTRGIGSRYNINGSATVINVPDATAFGYKPVMIDFGSVADAHTSPSSNSPNLGEGSQQFYNDFQFSQSSPLQSNNGWNAMTATLQLAEITGDYLTLPALGAESEWVITLPTKSHYVNNYSPNSPIQDWGPFEQGWTNAYGGSSCHAFDREDYDRSGNTGLVPAPNNGQINPIPANNLCWTTNILSFNNSDILGGNYTRTLISTPSHAGSTVLSMPISQNRYRTYHSSSRYTHGLPAIGFAVQTFVNSNASATGSTNNYATAIPLDVAGGGGSL